MLNLLCTILRGEAFDCDHLDEMAAARFYALAREHGVHLLVADVVCGNESRSCPPALYEQLAAALRNQFAIEVIARREVQVALEAMCGGRIMPLLFKGTALAYTHYPDSFLRPRCDTDLLVADRDAEAAGAVLETLGYRRAALTSGDLVMYQAAYTRIQSRLPQTIDVHWRIANPQVFSRAYSFEELRARATPVRALGGAARTLADVDALVVACIHRVAHHAGEERLIWLYDIHLVAERLTAADQEMFLATAEEKKVVAVCVDGLRAAARAFEGVQTAALVERLEHARIERHERSAIYTAHGLRKMDVLISDLRALDGWKQRASLMRQHLFPPTNYMRSAYGISNGALLPVFYVWRIARGASRWLRTMAATDRR
jgi:hypothetical protein